MKTTVLARVKVLFIVFCLLSISSFGQQTLTKINGWNAYVHLPDDYNSTGSQTYPCIIFFPGTGEVGTNASLVISNGPGHFLASGWNGNVTVNGVTVKPIIISLQPPAVYPQVPAVDQQIETIKTLYRVDPKRISLTGLSMGGWVSELFVETHPEKIASVVAIQAVRPDDNPAYPAPFATYAKTCGHWLGYEQINDARDMNTIYKTMIAALPGSAVYFQTNVGGGGHCCWNTWYDPAHTDNYALNGVTGNWTIYQYMLSFTQCGASANIAPTVSAGSAQTIVLPTNSVTLKATATGNGGATITGSSWTKTSGGAATITSPSSLSTTVTGLVAGTYSFSITATDNHGLTSSSAVNITVNAAVVKVAPTVNAGPSQTITLGDTAVPVTPQSAYFNFSTASKIISGWSNMYGSPNSAIVTAKSNNITMSSVATGNWAPYNGITSYDGNGVNAAGFFANAAISVNNWFQYGDPANFNAAKPQLQASGLVPGTSYTIKISGSDNLGFDTNPARYTLVGASQYPSMDLNLDYTADQGAVFNNIYPDANGLLKFYINSVSGSSQAAEVNGIQIIPNSGSSAASQQTASQTSATANLNGSASGNNGATIVSVAWTQTGGASSGISSPSSLNTTVTGLVAGVYTYQLVAKDNNGMSSSSVLTITVVSPGGIVSKPGTKTMQVNIYGGQNPYANAAWNNWNVTPAITAASTSSPFNYSDGTSSPITATMSTTQGLGDNGAAYGGSVTAPEVLRYGSYNSFTRTVTLKNIPYSTISSIEIFGSRNNTGNTSIYTINGVSNSLVTDNNLTKSAIFQNIKVTNGQVQITIDKTTSFNYINGFILSFSSSAATNEASTLVTMQSGAELTQDLNEKLSVYPNPFESLIHVRWENAYMGTATLAIYSSDGRLIRSKNIVKDQFVYNDQFILPALGSGLYILQARLPNGKVFVQKIMKN